MNVARNNATSPTEPEEQDMDVDLQIIYEEGLKEYDQIHVLE